ncbi:MAG: tetratricopeptide repeat protein [Candidatus Riflebacteria bacterium]|nr:tetratricopeptide repeat protein [Candidatus Riflebacteria bacterium]
MAPTEREFFQTLSSLFAQDRVADMKALLDAERAARPDSAGAHFWRGRLAEKAHDTGLAITCYEAAIRAAPQNPAFHAFLAQALERQRDLEALGSAAPRQDPGPAAGPPSRGTGSGLLARIEASWRQAVALAPRQGAYQARLAWFLADQGRTAEAFDQIQAAFQDFPQDDDVRTVWIRVNLKLGSALASSQPPDLPRALEHLGHVLRLDPAHGDANLFTGLCLKKAGRLDEAVACLERSLPERPDEQRAFLFLPFFELATILLERGNRDRAREIVRRGLAIDPQSPALRELLARTDPVRPAAPPPPLPGAAMAPVARPAARPVPAAPPIAIRQPLTARLQGDLDALPAPVRPVFADLVAAVESGQGNRIESLARKLQGLEPWTNLAGTEARLAMGGLCHALLQEVFDTLPAGDARGYRSLLTLTVKAGEGLGDVPGLRDLVPGLFRQAELLARAFVDPGTGEETRHDQLYEIAIHGVRDWLASAGLRSWLALEGSREILVSQVSRWMRDLANHLQNRREDPFFHLLDTLLTAQAALPAWAPSFGGLAFLVPAARKAFHDRPLTGEDRFGALFAAHAGRASPDLRPEFDRLVQAWQRGLIPPTPPVHRFTDSPELTVEFVYRSALEEILGDGRVTAEEEVVLQSLRDFLEIPPHEFQRIFQEVTDRKQANQLPVLDRDFSAEEFLFRILEKMMEDGQISEAEREIIRRVSNALLVSQDTLARVFRRVKETGQTVSQSLGEETRLERRRVIEAADQVEREGRARSLFFTEQGQRVLGRVKEIFDAFRATTRQAGKDKEAALLSRFSVTAFFCEPQAFPVPVIAVFVDGPNVHPLRLRFKGGRLGTWFATDAATLVGAGNLDAAGKALVVENEALGFPVGLQNVLLEEDLLRFLRGIDAAGGKYAFLLVQHGFLSPVALIPRKGWVDASGLTQTGLGLLADGLPEEAAALFAELHRRQPRLHDTWTRIGQCHAALALRGTDPGRHLPLAREAFQKELELDPAAWKAMLGLGRLAKQAERWDESVQWLKKALEAAPAAIPVLGELVTTLYDRDRRDGIRFSGIPEYLPLYLGRAHGILPGHPVVVSLLEHFGRIFQADLPRVFRQFPADTRFQ